MATIGKVRAVFTANSSGLTSGVNSAAASMRKMESSVASLRSGMSALVAIQGVQFFSGVATAAGGYIRSLIAMGQAQADVVDSTSKLAARTGMAYGEFAGLALAGDLAGVGMDTVAKAATKADIAFVKAQQGSKVAQAAFATLGLSMDQLAGMGAADRFEAIAAAIGALPNEAQRAAAATQLFGRAGAELLPLFAGGADGIREAREQAERLGLALTTAQGQDVEAMNDAWTLAGQAINGIVQQVTAYLAPAVTAIADTFTNLVGSIGGANIGQAIGDGILQGARFLATIGDWLISNLSAVWQYVSEVGLSWADTFKFANQVASFFAMVGRGWLTVFLTLVRVAITPAANLLETAAKIARLIPGMKDQAAAAIAASESARSVIDQAIAYNATAAAENFSDMISGEGSAFGDAAAGPLLSALDGAILQAGASATSIDEAGRGAADQIAGAVAAAVEPQALKGIDSRSTEGVAEMFRLMRGGDTVQEQQLRVQEQIRDELAGGDDSYPFAFE
jgi:hypothetical protein